MYAPEPLSFSWLYHGPVPLRPVVEARQSHFQVIQTSELKDASQFIQPDSIVLTLAIAFGGHEDQLGDYIRHLGEAGAVAIGFGTGVPFATIPQVVIDTARQCGLGLFEVAQEVPFISIVSAVYNEQQRLGQQAQRTLFATQEKLTQVATSGNLARLLSETAAQLGGELTITDGDGRLIASASAWADGANAGAPPQLAFTTRYAMTPQGQRTHELVLRTPQAATSHDRSLVRHCAGLADMLLFRPVELRRARNELNTVALSLKLGRDTTGTVLPDIFKATTDSHGYLLPVVITADDRRSLTRALDHADKNAEEHSRFLYYLPLEANACLFLFRGDRTHEAIKAMFGPALARIRLVIGGRITWDKLTAEHVTALTRRASPLALGEAAVPDQGSITWLEVPEVAQALSARHTEVFGLLDAYDNHHNTELSRTLSVFVRHHGQLSPTAEALGVHRHTVRNRIARIQDLCSLDLSDPAVFSELFFASLSAH